MNVAGLLIATCVIFIVCLFYGFMADRIASLKEAGTSGFLYGFLLGPFGVVAAGFLDKRSQCPNCGGRLNGKHHVCQHCVSKLEWVQGRPMTPEMAESHRELRKTAENENESANPEPESVFAVIAENFNPPPKFDEWGNPLDLKNDPEEASV